MLETSAMTWILINLAFAVMALGVGFFAGAFWFGGKPAPAKPGRGEDQEGALEKRIALERALLASGQLHDLAAGVATDVGEHTRCVQAFSADLKNAEGEDGVIDQARVDASLKQMLAANDTLQSKLDKAEKQIKQQALEIAAHENEARTDSLTGLANRRAFDDEVARRFSEWQRKGTDFCLLILDVDHFKKFNDTHGHQAGDEVLRSVSKALQASTRTMDIPCRYGGEEFAIVLPATKLEDATMLSERVRSNIESAEITHDGKTLSVTASLGVAEVQQGDDGKLLLRRADEALYEAKDAGRNRSYYNQNGANHPVEGTVSGGGAPSNQASLLKGKNPPIPLRLLDKLPSRTLTISQLSKRVAESHRTQQDLSILVVEAASYGQLKQQYGEGVASVALDSVAQVLEKSVREMDSIGRIAEDRLAVILPGAPIEIANRIGQRVSATLASCQIPLGEETLNLDARLSQTGYAESDTAALMLERATKGLVGADSAPPVLA